MSTEQIHDGADQQTGGQERHRRTLTGVVVSTSGTKTAVVKVERTFLHPQYRKYVRQSKKYMAHDEHQACSLGDVVIIEECRPMSARKRWRLRSVTRKNEKV